VNTALASEWVIHAATDVTIQRLCKFEPIVAASYLWIFIYGYNNRQCCSRGDRRWNNCGNGCRVWWRCYSDLCRHVLVEMQLVVIITRTRVCGRQLLVPITDHFLAADVMLTGHWYHWYTQQPSHWLRFVVCSTSIIYTTLSLSLSPSISLSLSLTLLTWSRLPAVGLRRIALRLIGARSNCLSGLAPTFSL